MGDAGMTKTIRKLLGYLLVISLLLSCVSALAETGTVKVKVTTKKEKGFTNPAGIEFEIYKVANSVGTGTTWEATSDFAISAKGFEKEPANGTQWSSDPEIKEIMALIEADLKEGKPQYKEPVKTDSEGIAVFDELDPGIYYIRKNPDSKTRLKGSASLIAVPYFNESDPNGNVTKTDNYNVQINAKYEFEDIPKIDYPVTKVWQDDNDFDGLQPTEIKVHLHRRFIKKDESKEEDKSFAELASSEQTLTAKNNWTYKWEDLDECTEDDEKYEYYVEEDDVTGYTDARGEDKTNGTITNVHNPKYGALVVTKQVTVNGQPTTSKMADGVYTFTITGPKDEDFKKNGTVKNEHNYLDNVPFSISITDGKAYSWSHDKLMPGTYTIKETSTLTNGMTIANGNAERTIEVKAENTAQSPAVVTYVNNLPVGSLKITKSVTVNGSATTGTRADGTYRFRVTGPSYPNGETVSIRIRNGKSVKDVQLDNLLLGEYEVTEIKTGLPSGVRYVSGDAKKTMAATNTAQNPLTFPFVNNRTTTTTTTNPPRVTPTPPRTTEPPESTPTPTPTPSPTPAVNINGEKVWRDEGNTHNTRPTSIKVQLMRDGEQIREITVTGSGNRWSYSFGNLPKVDEQGAQYSYTVRETPVEGYTTTVRGTSIINDLEERTPQNYTNFTGAKIWKDDEDSSGERPNYITVRLLRDGREVDRRTVTAANGWQFTFQNVPLDDGYGNTYRYTIREDSVPGYVGRVEDFEVTNSRLPEREVLTEFSRYGTPLAGFGEPELEELLELYDYGTPLWGRPLQTGDELPLYPIVFGGIGCTAIIALVVLMILNKKKGRNAA